MNTYIQNKLDKFRKLTIQLRKKHFTIDTGGDGIVEVLPNLEEQARYNNGIEKFIEQSLTDYHNHIVEKIESEFDENTWTEQDGIRYDTMLANRKLQKILTLLQDTNPKE